MNPELKERLRKTQFGDKYDRKNTVGQGTYASVFHAVVKSSGNGKAQNEVAVKMLEAKRKDDGIARHAVREVGLLKEIRMLQEEHGHLNILTQEDIVPQFEATTHENRDVPERTIYCVFKEFASFDLHHIISWHRSKVVKGHMDLFMIKAVLKQTIDGVAVLHKHWIMHRDLKPANILLMAEPTGSSSARSPFTGSIRIADFGMARLFDAPLGPLSHNFPVVTLQYRAPELLLGEQNYTAAVDIWSLGCIFAEMVIEVMLFNKKEGPLEDKLGQFVKEQFVILCDILGKPDLNDWPEMAKLEFYPQTEDIPATPPRLLEKLTADGLVDLGEHGPDLLRRMLTFNPEKRITAEEALDHPFFHTEPTPPADLFYSPSGSSFAKYMNAKTAKGRKHPANAVANSRNVRQRQN